VEIEKKEPVTLLTLKEAAAVLRVSTKTVSAMIQRGMPARKVGRSWRISVESLNEWFNNGADGASVESQDMAGETKTATDAERQ